MSVFDSPTEMLSDEPLPGGDNHTAEWYPLLDMFVTISYQSHLIMAVIMSVILVMAVTGNLTVIGVFLGCAKLRTPSNLLIVNLAVADLLMALTGFPLLIANSIHGAWIYSYQVCHFYGATATMFGLMSINTLVFISLDRLIVIISPQHLVRISYKHAAFCIVAAWGYSAAWAAFPLLGWNRYIIEGYGTTCSIDYFTRQSPDRHFLLAMFLADYIFPILIIIVCYSNIFHSVRQHLAEVRNFTAVGRTKPKPKWSSTQYKIARTCLVVVVMYCLTWTPYAIIVLMGQYGDLHRITPTNSMLPAVFAKFSTVYNPIIYALSHPQFKDTTYDILVQLRIIRKKKGRGNVSGTTDSSRAAEDGRPNDDDHEENECRQPMVEITNALIPTDAATCHDHHGNQHPWESTPDTASHSLLVMAQ